MKLVRICKHPAGPETITKYPENYAFNEGIGYRETLSVFNLSNCTEKVQQIYLDGVRLAFFNRDLEEDLVYDIHTDFPYLQMHFGLSGTMLYTPEGHQDIGCRIDYGHHSLFYYPALNGRLTYPAGKNILNVEIEISLSWLQRVFNYDLTVLGKFADEMERGRPAILGGKCFPLTRQLRHVLMEIYHCGFTGSLKKIFVEGKLLELLSLQVKQITSEPIGITGTALKETDIDRLHFVKDLLLQHIDNPHSIHALASLAGMNRTKLQSGFKDVFGSTIYGYLTEERMNRARELLMADQYIKISEVARRIGYKNSNHFSAAFRKKFGYLPRDIKN